jgi:hypothetical protein
MADMPKGIGMRYWVAVRATEGREWVDSQTFSPDREWTEKLTTEVNAKLPASYLAVNPVIRYMQVTIQSV